MADPRRAQQIYDELNRRGVFTQNERAQQIGHELRRRGVVTDPTQGGLFSEKPATATPQPAGPPADTSTLRTPYSSRIKARLGPNVDLAGLHPDAQAALTNALDEAAAQGINATLTSAKRSAAKQAKLYASRATNPYPVAPPGTSKHETGHAFDLDVPKESRAAFTGIMERHGFRWGGRFRRPDAVHYEWAGAGTGKLSPAPAKPAQPKAVQGAVKPPKATPKAGVSPRPGVGELRFQERTLDYGTDYPEERPKAAPVPSRQRGPVGKFYEREVQPRLRAAMEFANPFPEVTAAPERMATLRIQLQEAGAYKPLPALSAKPEERQGQLKTKRELLQSMEFLANRSNEADPWLYFKRNPGAMRKRLESMLTRKLSPWEAKLFPSLLNNRALDSQVERVRAKGLATDIAKNLAFEFIGGAAGERFLASALGRRLPKGVGEVAGAAVSGGVASSAIAGGEETARSLAAGERPGQALRHGVTAAGQAFLPGALGGAAFSGLHHGPTLLRESRSRLGVLAGKAKARVTGKPRTAVEPGRRAPAGPQAHAPDGSLVNLREVPRETLRVMADAHDAAGNPAAAERMRAYTMRHDAWDGARVWQIPRENIPDYLAAWNRKSDPVRRHVDVLQKAATDESVAPEVRPVLQDAAVEMGRTFVDGFRASVEDPFPRIGPPEVSPWRRLSAEERRSLPPETQKALLALDAINSQRVLDPEKPWPAELKGKTPAQWERQADALYRQAQAELEKELGPLPEPAMPEVAPRIEAPETGVVGQPEARPGEALPPEPTPRAGSARPSAAEPILQPEQAAPGELPSRYQAAVRRARAVEQPVGALESSPALRTRGEIVAQRHGVEPISSERAAISSERAAISTELGVIPGEQPARPLASAAEIAARRAGVEPIPPARAEVPVHPEAPGAETAAPIYAGPERRVDVAQRKRIAEMSLEEAQAALRTDEKTGLGNKRAWDETEKKPHIGYIDADGLSFVNGAYGHEAGDALLRALGDNLRRAGFGEGEAFHISGDEFVVHGDDRATLRKRIALARDIHEATVISFVDADGKTHSFKGVSFAQGIGPTEAKADKAMFAEKAKRTEKGLRATSKDVFIKDEQGRQTKEINPAARPPGMVEVPSAGGAVQEGNAPARPAAKRRGGGAAEGEARAVAAKAKKAAAKPVEHPAADVKPTPGRLKPGFRLYERRKGATWEIAGPVRTDPQGYKRVDARLISKPEEPKGGARIYDPVYSDVGDVRGLLVNEIAREMKFAPPEPAKPTPKPDAVVPAPTRERVNSDAAAAKARRAKGEAVPVRAEGDAGMRRAQSDTPGAVEGAPHANRGKKRCV